MPRLGLRALLLVPLLATLALGSLGLGVFVDRSFRRDMVASVDAELTRTGAGVRGAERGPGPALGLRSDDRPLVAVLSSDGAILDGSDENIAFLGDELAAQAQSAGAVTISSNPRYRVLSMPQPDGTTLVVGLSLETVDASSASLRRNLLVGGAVLVLAQALVVALVASAVSRPVTQISRAAHRISEGDLEAELGEPSGPRETAALNQDLTAMLGQLGDTIATKDQAAREALQARADMEQFMADASHELRTPLTALQGYSDLFSRGMLDAEGLERAMDRIGGESKRLSVLVNDLLNLARPVDESALQPIDLAAVVSAVAYDLRAAHPSHPISHDLAAAKPFEVIADPNRLHQAILNLGANACQHSAAGTPVAFRLDADDRAVTVHVVDHGTGIDPTVADDLFVAFARGDASRSRRSHDGAGLGLALVRRIANQHHGDVSVSSTPGGGATFSLRIPRGDASA